MSMAEWRWEIRLIPLNIETIIDESKISDFVDEDLDDDYDDDDQPGDGVDHLRAGGISPCQPGLLKLFFNWKKKFY